MESTSISSRTELLPSPSTSATPPILKLRLQKKKTSKKVEWTDGTVDNEHLNRKKSKCCCIYKKPLVFGESSSEDEEECEHCFGHPEKKIKNRADDSANHSPDEPLCSKSDNGGCTSK
ncbi:E3 ubiquitin-protein ligase PPP1R11 isoform X2 [Episyrphus balteatus]|uniref:E3 ubiquitin-protein ligase PPP1R11 isoform X2 n=1 Tax=Episyrphus balteatus TaxID=286459 RepID=UPI002485AF7E|nr:E3 ubiquitin-protein ligase PPP1R11 isoform X2 [Episyrphus balteatus]